MSLVDSQAVDASALPTMGEAKSNKLRTLVQKARSLKSKVGTRFAT